MGILESFEDFSLVFDYHKLVFLLSPCYGDGKTLTFSCDKLEFDGHWRDDDTEEIVRRDTDYLIKLYCFQRDIYPPFCDMLVGRTRKKFK